MELDEVIDKRHSVRDFQARKPDWREIIKAIEAGTKAPLAGNIPIFKFILVDDDKKIKGLSEAAQQGFIQNSNYVVVLCSDPEQVERSHSENAEKYIQQEAGAAIENFLLKITDLNLATCWVGAYQDDAVKRVLKIPDNIRVEGLFPIGYESGDREQKTKPSIDNCLFFNNWGQSKMTPENIPRD